MLRQLSVSLGEMYYVTENHIWALEVPHMGAEARVFQVPRMGAEATVQTEYA